jgi:hypothetical protein
MDSPSVPSNYLDPVFDGLDRELPTLSRYPALRALYALLVVSLGDQVTPEDVHDAWAICYRDRDHPDLVPWPYLEPSNQQRDVKYAQAIRAVAREIGDLR